MRPAVFSAGRVLFFGSCFFVPVCGALLLRSVPRRCSALCRVVILGLHRLPSSFVSCLRLCRVSVCALSPLLPCAAPLFRPVPRCHPRSASVAVPVCAVSPLRFASHCHPLSASCRRSGLWMAAATAEFRGRSDGDSAPAAGLLRPFPALRRFRSGRVLHPKSWTLLGCFL